MGLRLSFHIGRHPRGAGRTRYEKLLGGTLEQVGMARAVRKVFAIQGFAIWLVSLPVMVGVVVDVEWWPVVIAGSALWLVGLAFEAVGDAQLAAYKEIPKAQRPQVLQRAVALDPTPARDCFGDAGHLHWGLWLVGGLGSGWAVSLRTRSWRRSR